MTWRLLAACALAAVFILVPEVQMGHPGELVLSGPTDLSFEGDGLVITDQGGRRRVVVDPEGRYVDVRKGDFSRVSGQSPQTVLGRHLAWELGLEGAEFTIEAQDVDQEAWADPWRSLVLWNSHRGPLVLETLRPAWYLALVIVLWPLGVVALAVVFILDGARLLGRWLGRPSPALRVATVVVPLVGVIAVLIWNTEHQNALTREAEVRRSEMVFLGQVVGRGETPGSSQVLASRGYTWVAYRVEGETLVPRPRDGQIRAYLAAVRSGRVQTLEAHSQGGVGVLVPLSEGSVVRALVEVRWNRTPSPGGPWWAGPLVGMTILALVTWGVARTLGRTHRRSAAVRPLDAVPRRWLEAWGPDLLAQEGPRLPVTKNVVVVTWPADAGPEWTLRLADAGVIEVDAQAGVRRGLSPGGVAPLVPLWNEEGPRWLSVEVRRLGLGLVDTGDRLVPVTTLPEATPGDRGLKLDATARRLWPRRVGEGSRSLV